MPHILPLPLHIDCLKCADTFSLINARTLKRASNLIEQERNGTPFGVAGARTTNSDRRRHTNTSQLIWPAVGINRLILF